MIRDELGRAIEVLGDHLPGGRFVILVRRAFGDRGVTFLRGDVERVTGVGPGTWSLPTEKWLEIVHPDDRDAVRERLSRLPDTDELRLEYRIVLPSGEHRWIDESLRVRRTGPGTPPEVVGLLVDATFERTIQARVSRLETELWRSRKLESVGTMATGVAHDFNNLLTVILAASDLLRHDPDLSESTQEDLRVIRDAATRGAELVRQILAFAARRPTRVDALHPGRFVDDMAHILRRAVGPRVGLSVEADEETWAIQVDRAHLEQILINLTANAREAMAEGGLLTIRVSNEDVTSVRELDEGRLRPGRYVRVSVQDTGAGIDPGVRERLFEPFFSTKRGGPEDAGGFGLTTVLRIVRGYHGGIAVESELGMGAAFHVWLPADVPVKGRRERCATTAVQARGRLEDPAAGAFRILLVEDDASVRRMVFRMLEAEGHSVVAASTAAEGLQIFDRVRPPFDVLVTDVVLPDRSGHDLWRAAARRVAELPVVYMTGHDRRTVLDEGVSDPDALILEKPLTPGDLLEAVQAAVERVRGADLTSSPNADAVEG